MATTNLISRSLGDVLVQSGTGSPDHIAPSGSLYSDTTTGEVYTNVNGLASGWANLQPIAFGEMYVTSNTTNTTISTTNAWVTVSGITFLEGEANGVVLDDSPNDHRLKVQTGRGGEYNAMLTLTLKNNGTGGGEMEAGFSINGAVPSAGNYKAALINADVHTAMLNTHSHLTVTDGDTVSVAIRNTTSTNDILVHSVNLLLQKVK